MRIHKVSNHSHIIEIHGKHDFNTRCNNLHHARIAAWMPRLTPSCNDTRFAFDLHNARMTTRTHNSRRRNTLVDSRRSSTKRRLWLSAYGSRARVSIQHKSQDDLRSHARTAYARQSTSPFQARTAAHHPIRAHTAAHQPICARTAAHQPTSTPHHPAQS